VADHLAATGPPLIPVGLGGAANGPADIAAVADRALTDFLRERHKGTRPIAYGSQLQEWAVTSGIHWGTLGVGAMTPTDARG
jgi:hypothetical protein